MPCQATVYEGSDHVDDVVAFCDPGKASGVRLSWSMSFNDGGPRQRALLDDFMRVVVASHYRHYVAPPLAKPATTSSFTPLPRAATAPSPPEAAMSI